MNIKLFKHALTDGYVSPAVNSIHFQGEGVLCGSFEGAQIPGYGEEDVWADD